MPQSRLYRSDMLICKMNANDLNIPLNRFYGWR